MIPFDLSRYQAVDTLYLWWLAKPEVPRLIGELRMARSLQGVSLVYAQDWLATGFALSEDLPLTTGEFFPADRETAAGAVDDARPDRWGERVIRVLDKPPRLAVLDFLFYAGDERFGALGVSISPDAYVARDTGALPRLADVLTVEALVQQVLAGASVDERLRRLISPGTTLGGARPKALLNIEGHPWVLKFGEPGDLVDTPLVEHATMTLAEQAGIRVALTQPVKVHQGHAVAVKRFDRAPGLRRHAISANVALKAAGEAMGYPELAQWLRRRGVTEGGRHLAQMHELFRRMVFNILIDNTDDHEKNHVLLMTDRGEYELSPAFDVLPSGQALGYQQMRVGKAQTDATLDNALSECAQFGLKRPQAVAEIKRVCGAVAGWKAHFAQIGVSAADIESLAAQIDRPFLRDQRNRA
ncbi:type II toxin-antitoxin system HipA family toxin [Hydrogenophaga sp. BPS33]|uniref:type II toxin-antitoxin system HipA family toxin n=1 Tax=Hydrogenophaga sp. BPS33 TaxID=2651974 RepID=UPI00131F5E71|nr:HipA domain-containing protein [Hydrogenophaga sp. BPS33]QHE88379.1 HipA domain-containing protein [Hydrogenophaga sp. BPS33]